MADEFERIEGVHIVGADNTVVRSEVVHAEVGPAGHMVMTTETAVSAVDWDAAPVYAEHETVIAASHATAVAAPVAVAPARGRWDFTDAQRIILALLIWLNILVLLVGYLALTGQLMG